MSQSTALAYHRRRRTLAHRDAWHALKQTQEVEVGTVDLDDLSSDERHQSITFEFEVRILANTAQGYIFEWGGLTKGCGVWITPAGKVGCGAGHRPSAVDGSRPQPFTNPVSPNSKKVPPRDEPYTIVFAIKTGTGEVRHFNTGAVDRISGGPVLP